MKNIQILLAYDGTSFLGWQKTPLGATIEGSLEKVLFQILQEPIHLQAASRTDAGVHAEGQSVNFLTHKSPSLDKLLKSINSLLPPSISALEIKEKDLSFHPTLESRGKEYHYLVCNTPFQLPRHRFFSWHISSPLNIHLMKKAAFSLLGTHDFSSFCNERSLFPDKDPICTLESIEIDLIEENRFHFKIKGNRFLYKMMRNLIGTLIYVGLGKIPPQDVEMILKEKKRSLAGVTAPAHGLHLIRVFY